MQVDRGEKIAWGNAHIFLENQTTHFAQVSVFCVCACVINFLQSQTASYYSLEQAEAKICWGLMLCWSFLDWLTTI